ncbi:hypothetical protein ACHAXA_005920 [Cyclostephanos tholiformis]|uniref:Uncharacterized protein n=1 Tax=Cyclostephanos tholiformis TaxID=382380 RepID=A0ABD3SCN3_9STRA
MSILRMALTSRMEEAQSAISSAMLTALDIGPDSDDDDYDGRARVSSSASPEPFSTVHPRLVGSSGSICFVVRRPG